MEHYYRDDTTNVEAAMLLGVSLGRTYDRMRALYLFDQVEKIIQPSEEQLYNLAIQRGNVKKIDFKYFEAMQYYWHASQIGSKNRLAALSLMASVGFSPLAPTVKRTLETASPEQYAKALFAYVAYLKAVYELAPQMDKATQSNVTTAKHVLTLFLEDMFFKDTDRLQMESPDGKKEWITREALEKLAKDEL
jgi:hypothetical protein